MAWHGASPQSGNPTARRVVLVGVALHAVVLVAGRVLAGLCRAGVGGFRGADARISVAAEPDIAGHVYVLAEGADGCCSLEVAPVSSARGPPPWRPRDR